jgi:hypothetical protein
MQFTKLFNSILDSTIWQEPLETKVVWITMLAMCDRNGDVHASIPGLARRAGVTITQCNAALACLESPDEYSRTKDHDGRRIAEIDGGWSLLNHGKYRALLSAEERREYNRRKQAEYRAARKSGVNDMSMTVNDNEQCPHITEAEAEAEAEKKEILSASGRIDADFVAELWKSFPAVSRNRSSKKQVESEWRKARPKPDTQAVIQSARKWACSQEWTKQGGQFAPAVHLWVKNRKWESEPESVAAHNGFKGTDEGIKLKIL